MKLTREFYTPKGAIKVADKRSDAVAYLYSNRDGSPCAVVFYGRQSKPVARFRYRDEAHRAAAVAAHFERRQAVVAYKAAQRKAKAATVRRIEVGALYYATWGYEQTNVDFYEVVELVGKTSARVRPIRATDANKGDEPFMTGKAIPCAGDFKGPAMLVRVEGDRFKVDGHRANLWNGRPVGWTAYA